MALFQFTPLREGRPRKRKTSAPIKKFQFTPLREGRHLVIVKTSAIIDFNSRPSARGDRKR